jgi:hypothetical protein
VTLSPGLGQTCVLGSRSEGVSHDGSTLDITCGTLSEVAKPWPAAQTPSGVIRPGMSPVCRHAPAEVVDQYGPGFRAAGTNCLDDGYQPVGGTPDVGGRYPVRMRGRRSRPIGRDIAFLSSRAADAVKVMSLR